MKTRIKNKIKSLKNGIKRHISRHLSNVSWLRLGKVFGLWLLVVYSIAVFGANIAYYKYKHEEIFALPKIGFGIDIVGGTQLTVSIDTSDVVDNYYFDSIDVIKNYCKDKKITSSIVQNNDKNNYKFTLNVSEIKSGKNTFNKKDKNNINTLTTKQLHNELKAVVPNMDISVVSKTNNQIVFEFLMNEKHRAKVVADATDKAIAILKNRVDGVGVKEISVQRYGADKIVILVPEGVDIDRVKKVVNTTAKLTFHLMDAHHVFIKPPKKYLPGHKILEQYGSRESQGGDYTLYYLVETEPAMNGDVMVNAQPDTQSLQNAITFRLNNIGTKKFADITSKNIGRALAIVLDDKVLMAPVINTPIVNGSGMITGHFSMQEAMDLSVLLRSGSLPAKISIISDNHLSSVFDTNVLSSSFNATIVGILCVFLLLIFRYRLLGGVACIALILNFLFSFAIICVFGFTITLPGFAGLVLMLGMASDANILIYEKMRELRKQGMDQVNHIINNGFSKALATIIDSNLTTIIATIALFGFGSSFIKGFSITLIVGILCSIFTSVNITRMIVEEIFNNGRRKKII